MKKVCILSGLLTDTCVDTQKHKSSADYFLRNQKKNFLRDVEALPPWPPPPPPSTHTNLEWLWLILSPIVWLILQFHLANCWLFCLTISIHCPVHEIQFTLSTTGNIYFIPLWQGFRYSVLYHNFQVHSWKCSLKYYCDDLRTYFCANSQSFYLLECIKYRYGVWITFRVHSLFNIFLCLI
jgi:hypothetical protein